MRRPEVDPPDLRYKSAHFWCGNDQPTCVRQCQGASVCSPAAPKHVLLSLTMIVRSSLDRPHLPVPLHRLAVVSRERLRLLRHVPANTNPLRHQHLTPRTAPTTEQSLARERGCWSNASMHPPQHRINARGREFEISGRGGSRVAAHRQRAAHPLLQVKSVAHVGNRVPNGARRAISHHTEIPAHVRPGGVHLLQHRSEHPACTRAPALSQPAQPNRRANSPRFPHFIRHAARQLNTLADTSGSREGFLRTSTVSTKEEDGVGRSPTSPPRSWLFTRTTAPTTNLGAVCL